MRTLLVAILVVAALTVPAVPVAAQDEPFARMVRIAVGDHWEYRLSGRDNGEVRNEVTARGMHTNHLGERVDSYRIKATGTVETEQSPLPLGVGVAQPGVPITLTFSTHKWIRATDYAVVEIEGNSTTTGQQAVYAKESFSPPMVEVVFEFGVGWQWKSESHYRLERNIEPPSENDVSFIAKVEAYETVTVEAGTFMAWRINSTSYKTSNAWTLQWYSEAACDLVKEERYDDQNNLINRLELTDWRCDGTVLQRPVYDPEYVTLLARGETPPPDWDPTPTNDPDGPSAEASGLGWAAVWGALGAALIAIGAVAWLRRR